MKKNHSNLGAQPVSRRSVLKFGVASGAMASVGSLGLGSVFCPAAAQAAPALPQEDFLTSVCANNCGSTCILRPVVQEGRVMRVDTDNSVEDNWQEGVFQVRACPRGRSMRRHMYAPNRLQYPLKRTGERGSGKFERISWEEALDTIANKLVECKTKYGNESICSLYASGVQVGALMRRESFYRLMNLMGGFALGTSDYSSAQNQYGLKYLYGQSGYSGNPTSDIAHTKLAVFFGLNITETRMSGGGLQYEVLEAKRKGNTRVIVIDPRYTDTCVTIADEWIPIRPGTDAALASALAYVLITENMVDNDFVRTHVQGYDASSMPEGFAPNLSYKDYIMGTGEDTTPKTPQWAAAITGIPATRIIQLAREIGGAKPCYITQGWGLQRQAAGEMNTMAVAALATLTGNIGLRGGNNGDLDGYSPGVSPRLPAGTNPVKARFPTFLWLRAVERGKEMTALKDGIQGADRFPANIKFIWNYAGNCMVNQHSDINETRRVLSDTSKCEMIVVMDTHMTASAQWADIVLPSASYLEQSDIVGPSYAMNTDWLAFTTPVKPFFESRPVYDVCVDLAKRLGIEKEFTEGRSREDWLEYLYETNCRKNMPTLPETLAEARKVGLFMRAKNRDALPVRFAEFRNDPVANPLKTPSGKVELFSPALHTIGKTWELEPVLGNRIPPSPQYVATWEGFEDKEGKAKFPLQMITSHYKGRTHSHYASVDWLLEVMPQVLWMNPLDAQKRGIEHNEVVKVFNGRGEVRIAVKVTPRIMPGVVTMPQGAWYKPDANGVDHGGCANTLTLYRPSPLAKGNPQHTNLVEVAKL